MGKASAGTVVLALVGTLVTCLLGGACFSLFRMRQKTTPMAESKPGAAYAAKEPYVVFKPRTSVVPTADGDSASEYDKDIISIGLDLDRWRALQARADDRLYEDEHCGDMADFFGCDARGVDGAFCGGDSLPKAPVVAARSPVAVGHTVEEPHRSSRPSRSGGVHATAEPAEAGCSTDVPRSSTTLAL